MTALHDAGYPTPKPIGQSRHVVAMGLVRGVPLYQLHTNRVSADQAQSIYEQSAALAGRMARHGLVHCDLNEFNLMVDLSGVQDRIAKVGGGGDVGDELTTLDGTAAGTVRKNWEDDASEHYARHSGLPSRIKGALNSNTSLHKNSTTLDGTGELVTEEPPVPLERLDNGEPKPIVTLIDFPQMISTRHPNARELYDRDVECLRRFFGSKLRCYVEGEDLPGGGIMPTWDELIAGDNEDDDDVNNGGEFPGDDVSLVSRSQHRLDAELKASRYSREDAARDTELAYYEAHQQRGLDHDLGVVDDVDDEEDEDSDDDNDTVEDGNTHEPEFSNVKELVNNDERAPELIDMDEFNIDNDGASISGDGVSVSGMSRMSRVSILSYAAVEQRARERVARHLDDRKRASGKKGAFKTRNSNKSYSKGRRVGGKPDVTDFGL